MAALDHCNDADQPDLFCDLYHGRGNWPGRAGRPDRSELLQSHLNPSFRPVPATRCISTARATSAANKISKHKEKRESYGVVETRHSSLVFLCACLCPVAFFVFFAAAAGAGVVASDFVELAR